MKFEEVLPHLKAGKRIIRESLETQYDQMWLYYDEKTKKIIFMNEEWAPSADQLSEDLLSNDWRVLD